MAWQTINASETDANSPLNQTLEDKVRGNLNALRVDQVGLRMYSYEDNSEGVGGTGYHDLVIDDGTGGIDWRDRFFVVFGSQKMFGNTQGYTITGANNASVGDAFLTTGSPNDYCNFTGNRFYSKAGSADRTTAPYCRAACNADPSKYGIVWVRASDGALMVSWYETGTSTDFCDITLAIFYSLDQGVV